MEIFTFFIELGSLLSSITINAYKKQYKWGTLSNYNRSLNYPVATLSQLHFWLLDKLPIKTNNIRREATLDESVNIVLSAAFDRRIRRSLGFVSVPLCYFTPYLLIGASSSLLALLTPFHSFVRFRHLCQNMPKNTERERVRERCKKRSWGLEMRAQR